MTRAGRVAWGRIGGLETLARHGGQAMTAAARKAFLARFERDVDPRGELDDRERAKRAEAARRAHMLKLAGISAAARAARRPQTPARQSTQKEAAPAISPTGA